MKCEMLTCDLCGDTTVDEKQKNLWRNLNTYDAKRDELHEFDICPGCFRTGALADLPLPKRRRR